jgi:dihydrofolate reductase
MIYDNNGMNITIIAALDQNRLIGKNGQLPWHLPTDLARFKKLTWGKPLIMGRKTHDSIGKILPGRYHIVLTRNKKLKIHGCQCFHSLSDALAYLKHHHECMIIGGESIFKIALPLANQMHLTQIHHTFEGNIYFPHFGSEWIETYREDFRNNLSYSFLTLKKNK